MNINSSSGDLAESELKSYLFIRGNILVVFFSIVLFVAYSFRINDIFGSLSPLYVCPGAFICIDIPTGTFLVLVSAFVFINLMFFYAYNKYKSKKIILFFLIYLVFINLYYFFALFGPVPYSCYLKNDYRKDRCLAEYNINTINSVPELSQYCEVINSESVKPDLPYASWLSLSKSVQDCYGKLIELDKPNAFEYCSKYPYPTANRMNCYTGAHNYPGVDFSILAKDCLSNSATTKYFRVDYPAKYDDSSFNLDETESKLRCLDYVIDYVPKPEEFCLAIESGEIKEGCFKVLNNL